MKANYLSLTCKGAAAGLAAAAAIAKMAGAGFDMAPVLAAAGFVAAAFLPVDVSKIKTAQAENMKEGA